MIFPTGLRQDLFLPDGGSIPNGDHTPSDLVWNLGLAHTSHDAVGPLTVRFDAINLLDKVYLIRSGTGIGGLALQKGAWRGLFGASARTFSATGKYRCKRPA